MLESVVLENFRGFAKHSLPLRETTVIVGKNNAGKSTIVEALRLISIVANRYRSLTYREAPSWSDLPRSFYGVAPSLKNIEMNFTGIFHRYENPPAIITANFSDKSSITIYLFSEERIHAVIRDHEGSIIKSRSHANKLTLHSVRIMPQVAPLQKQEIILSQDYVKAAASSAIAPLHFRNQLNIWYDSFSKFQRIVQDSWPGVMVQELFGKKGLPQQPLALHVRNEDFVAEVGAMGHGLQMWLQIMWFLTLSEKTNTIILDEPDVYMHADLQRRLIRLLRNLHPQTILTTHSVEILAEVQPEEILVVDKRRKKSIFTGSLPAVQSLIENVGSVHNIHLAKFFDANRFIIVEGKDLKILKQFQNIKFPKSQEPFDIIPNMSIGGWGGWNYAIGSSMVLRNAIGETISTYCILDSDYHSETEIENRYIEAKKWGVDLHIWTQKEIENFLIVPSVLCRFIQKNIRAASKYPEINEIESIIDEFALSLKNDILDAISSEISMQDRALGAGGANKRARAIIEKEENKSGNIKSLASGKRLISMLSSWSQSNFKVSLNAVVLAKEFLPQEIPIEMVKVIEAIELKQPFIKSS